MFSFKIDNTDYVIRHLDLEELLVCEYTNSLGNTTWLYNLSSFDIVGMGGSDLYENAKVFLNAFLDVINPKLEERHGNTPVDPPVFDTPVDELKWRVDNLLVLDGLEVKQNLMP